MSYILEALKKAQAERQLGSAPTIHEPAPSYAAPPPAAGGKGRYLAIGLGFGAAVLLTAALLLWQRQQDAAPVKVAQAPAAPVQAPAPAPAPEQPPAPAAAPESAVSTPAPAVAPPPEPAPPAPVKKPAPEAARAAAPKPPPRAESAPKAPEPAAAAPAADDAHLPTLQQLPEALQREIPRVSVGGYIYSPTPGESLLLIDTALRREGDQVAPGLVLERLMPKAAVMNYRGTRYRVGY